MKQIFNLKFDPFNRRRFAAVAEDQVQIFDLRASNQIMFNIKSDKDAYGDSGERHNSIG